MVLCLRAEHVTSANELSERLNVCRTVAFNRFEESCFPSSTFPTKQGASSARTISVMKKRTAMTCSSPGTLLTLRESARAYGMPLSPGIHVLTFSAMALTIPDRLELMPLDWSQYQNLSQCSTESTLTRISKRQGETSQPTRRLYVRIIFPSRCPPTASLRKDQRAPVFQS